jgi:hypothetical protein
MSPRCPSGGRRSPRRPGGRRGAPSLSSRSSADAQERPQRSQRPAGWAERPPVPSRRARRGCPVGEVWPALSLPAWSTACLAPLLWVVAALALALGLLLPLALAGAVLAGLALLLAPVALACRCGGGPPWAWLCEHYWCPWLWSEVCRCWVRWPRLCRHWLRQGEESSASRCPRADTTGSRVVRTPDKAGHAQEEAPRRRDRPGGPSSRAAEGGANGIATCRRP